MEKFYAYIRNFYKTRGPYRIEIFDSCCTKEDIVELCERNGYVILNDQVYTEEEWKAYA